MLSKRMKTFIEKALLRGPFCFLLASFTIGFSSEEPFDVKAMDFFDDLYKPVWVTSDILTGEHRIEDKQKPILLVHGYLGHSTNWVYLRYRLKEAGFGPIYTVNLGSPLRSIEEYAERVKRELKRIKEETGIEEVVMIGHSMGGLVSCYYGLELAQEDGIYVTDIITLGSPLKGTKVAHIGFGACAGQMRCKTPFIQKLDASILLNENIRFYHIGSEVDIVIQPTESAFLGDDSSKHYSVKGVGHLGLLFSGQVADAVISYLEGNS